ncbi:hypothetical protein CHISP_0647 [Chitinispirillum alkaliphilum]|nr:hypothetical protein CHISP_0647 [Chitinispirillum alkaliphilum]
MIRSIKILCRISALLFFAYNQLSAEETAVDMHNSEENIPITEKVQSDTVNSLPAANYFWGPGVAFTLGGIEAFSLWQAALPDSLGTFGLQKNYPIQYSDSSTLSYQITQKADPFNISIPIGLSVVRATENSMISAGVSFFTTGKKFQSTITIKDDSLEQKLNLGESIRFTSLALEMGIHKAIPQQYFQITGVDNSYFSAALSISPFSRISVGNTVSDASDDNQVANSVRDSVLKNQNSLASNGTALSWKLGITTLRAIDNRSNLKIGLYYSGSWFTRFSKENRELLRGELNPRASRASEPLSFVSNRLELNVSLLYGINSQTEKTRDSYESL